MLREKWTEEEIRILKDFCQNPDGFIEPLLPNRKWDAIWRKAWKMGLHLSTRYKIGGRSSDGKKHSKWTEENVQKLREYCENPVGEVETLFPDFKRIELLQKANKMGLKLPRKRFKWTDEDIQKLREYCENPIGEVEVLFHGFKRQEIVQKANSLGLKVPRKNHKQQATITTSNPRTPRKPVAPKAVWSDDETTTIISNYKKIGPYGTAELLPNKTPQDCFKFAKAIGIEKRPELTTNNREE